VVKDGKVEMRPVTVGFRVYDALVIEKGLAADETVVVEGHLRLVPGAPVAATPMPKAPAPVPAAPPAAAENATAGGTADGNATRPQ
jgi:membrane fusion protein (multidrug efflux system)